MAKMDKTGAAREGSKGVLLNIGSAGLAKIAGLLFYIFILRFITPAEGGIYFIYLAVASMISLLGAFGMTDALARFIPFYEGGGRKEKIVPLLSTVAAFFVLFSALVLGVVLFYGSQAVEYYNKDVAAIVPITFASGVLFSLNSLLLSALTGFRRFGENALYSALQPVLKIAFAAAFFAVFGPSLSAAIHATVAAAALVSLVSAFSVFACMKGLPGRASILPVREIREIVNYGISAALNQFSTYILGWTDTLVLGYYAAAAVIGAYNSVANIAKTVMQTIASQIFIVLTSMLSHLHGAKSDVFGPLASNGARWSAYSTLPFAALSVVFAKQFIDMLFPAYSEYHWLMYIFIPGLAVGILSQPARSALSAVGRSDLLFKSTVIGLVPNVALNLALIPAYGVLGAAAASILSYVASESAALHYAHRHAKFSFHPLILRALVPTFACAAAAYLSYAYLFDYSRYGWLFELAGVSLASSLALLVYLTLMKAGGAFNKTDYGLLEKFEKSALRLFAKN